MSVVLDRAPKTAEELYYLVKALWGRVGSRGRVEKRSERGRSRMRHWKNPVCERSFVYEGDKRLLGFVYCSNRQLREYLLGLENSPLWSVKAAWREGQHRDGSKLKCQYWRHYEGS